MQNAGVLPPPIKTRPPPKKEGDGALPQTPTTTHRRTFNQQCMYLGAGRVPLLARRHGRRPLWRRGRRGGEEVGLGARLTALDLRHGRGSRTGSPRKHVVSITKRALKRKDSELVDVSRGCQAGTPKTEKKMGGAPTTSLSRDRWPSIAPYRVLVVDMAAGLTRPGRPDALDVRQRR